MPKSKTKVDTKMQARLDAKVRPDEPVKEDRIYINMKKKYMTNFLNLQFLKVIVE